MLYTGYLGGRVADIIIDTLMKEEGSCCLIIF
jgi:hypothetical protein